MTKPLRSISPHAPATPPRFPSLAYALGRLHYALTSGGIKPSARTHELEGDFSSRCLFAGLDSSVHDMLEVSLSGKQEYGTCLGLLDGHLVAHPLVAFAACARRYRSPPRPASSSSPVNACMSHVHVFCSSAFASVQHLNQIFFDALLRDHPCRCSEWSFTREWPSESLRSSLKAIHVQRHSN